MGRIYFPLRLQAGDVALMGFTGLGTVELKLT
jgi:hypothetical protein